VPSLLMALLMAAHPMTRAAAANPAYAKPRDSLNISYRLRAAAPASTIGAGHLHPPTADREFVMAMLTRPIEISRRAASRVTGRIHTLPILALSVHSACNCRCVMCDIWKANVDKREISVETLDRHMDAVRRLHVHRVMLTGGEPLLHSNLWTFCDRLLSEGIALSLVTTGLLIEPHAARISELMDEVVISIDGDANTHDEIRRVRGGFDRIARGVAALRRQLKQPTLIARSVLQRSNFRSLAATIRAIEQIGVDRLSFLAADVTSAAFNRPEPWTAERQRDIALSAEDLTKLSSAIHVAEDACASAFASGFVAGGVASLWRIYDHYAALVGVRDWPGVRCNAPWVSAVVEPTGVVRPCFFHPAYDTSPGADLNQLLNSPQAIEFRRTLDVRSNETCKRCVCTLSLPLTRDA
jgi:Fe-coproporphyrin III synthase